LVPRSTSVPSGRPISSVRRDVGAGGSAFRDRVGDARAAQRRAEEAPLLLCAPREPQRLDQTEVRLRDLRDRRVGTGQPAKDLGQRAPVHVGAAVLGRNRDSE
jgi:hypothetical protein